MAFVGRERELAHLATALQRAADTETSRVAIVGSAGMGASRLLSELTSRLVDLPGVVVVRGQAYESCTGVPYQSLRTGLGPVLEALDDDRLAEVAAPAGNDLALLLPSLADRLDRLGAIASDVLHASPDQRGSRLAESVVGTLRRLAAGGVVLLAVEDLHWADPGTLGFLTSLLRTSRRLPICLVVSYRPDEIHRRHRAYPFVEEIRGRQGVALLELEPLHRDEVVRLVEDTLGERPSGAFLAALIEGSGGNPFLVEQLVEARTRVDGLRLSDPFEEILEARMALLSTAAVRCLRVLAAARRPLARELLQRIELDGQIAPQAISDALASGLAQEVAGETADGSSVTLIHDRCAEAIEAVTLPTERQALHAALAAASRDRPAEGAWHAEAAMLLTEARTLHVQAGREAEQVEPGETALGHYLRALELPADGQGRSADEASGLLAAAAQAAFVAGSFRRATTLAQHAISERSGTGSLRTTSARGAAARQRLQLEVALLYERLGRYRWASGDLLAAIDALETAAQLVPEGVSRDRAAVIASLAQHLMIDGRFADSAALAEQARTVARAVGESAVGELGHATCTLGVDVAYQGDLDRGLELLSEATALSRRAGRLDDVMRAYANRTTLLDLDLRRETALTVVKEGIAEARRWGMEGVYGAFLRGNAAEALFLLGRWPEAEAECRAALEWSPTGVAWFPPLLFLGQVVVESRADEEASRIVGQILLQLEAVPEGQWTAIVQRTAVSFALWRGDLPDALRVAARGWERVRHTDDWRQLAVAASTTLEACAAVSEWARAHRNFGTVAEASGLAREAIREAEARVMPAGERATPGARREATLHLDTARAHLARVHGRSDPDAWARLAEAWSAVPVPYQAAKARWWEAAAVLPTRDARGRARAALLEGWRIATELPAHPLQRELADLASRARIPLPSEQQEELTMVDRRQLVAVGPGRSRATPESGTDPASPTGREIADRLAPIQVPVAQHRFGLSPRESEVLVVLAEGRTNREIAERLFISERTVGVHVRRILAKLGVSGRVEAASVSIRLGLVPGGMPAAPAGRRA